MAAYEVLREIDSLSPDFREKLDEYIINKVREMISEDEIVKDAINDRIAARDIDPNNISGLTNFVDERIDYKAPDISEEVSEAVNNLSFEVIVS